MVLLKSNFRYHPLAASVMPTSSQAGNQHYPDKHALIVEDNALNAEVMATLLQKYGISSTIIETPALLDQTLHEIDHCDMMFLDLEFRYFDGFDVLNQYRYHARLDGVPIVAYTVHISEVERARREGFDGFLGKPIRQENFGEQLARIVQGLPVWDA